MTKHKHYDLIVRWAEGEKIELQNFDSTWSDDFCPTWYHGNEYRIKFDTKPKIETVKFFNQDYDDLSIDD